MLRVYSEHEFYPYDGFSDGLGPSDAEMDCRICGQKYENGNHTGSPMPPMQPTSPLALSTVV